MVYNTALRPDASKRLEEIEKTDIVVGIPCYNNDKTIEHVIQMVSDGLHKYYKDLRAVIFVADGGSTDDTRERAREFQLKPWQEKIITIYRGPAGKGSAFRAIFSAVRLLKAKVCAVVDSDLRSITSDWIHHLINPVLQMDFDYVSPIYTRHKFDGTITNNIIYNLTRSLYGKQIRQPIGGEFAFNAWLATFFLEQDVWDTDVARYGIDIWMTTMAIINDYKICQARLGVKIHDAKDPSESLGPMFRQVISTLFQLMEQNEEKWKLIKGSTPVPTFGPEESIEPEAVNINLHNLVSEFRLGFQHFSVLWKSLFSKNCYDEIRSWYKLKPDEFMMSMESWVQILYELASIYHRWEANRKIMMSMMVPLYFARVASFVNRTKDMTSSEAENLVEEQAVQFEEMKDYLIKKWNEKLIDVDAEEKLNNNH
jgi:glucosylglycerate synthase